MVVENSFKSLLKGFGFAFIAIGALPFLILKLLLGDPN